MTSLTPLGPVAEYKPHTVKFGRVDGEVRGANPMDPPIEFVDNLFWLRDDARKEEAVLSHLRAENAFTAERTAHLQTEVDAINAEHIAHLKETDTSVMTKRGHYSYYYRTVQGLSYRIHCRVKNTEGAAEEVLLDINDLAKGHAHCDVHGVDASPDDAQRLFVYSVDFKGDEMYDIVVATPSAGGGVPTESDVIKETDGSAVWGLKENVVLYVTKDAAKRSYKAWLHVVGTQQADDVCLATEDDELFSVGIGKTLQGDHAVIHFGSSETSEQLLVDLRSLQVMVDNFTTQGWTTTSPDDKAAALRALLRTVRPRSMSVRYSVAVHESGAVFVVTNADQSYNNKIIKTSLTALDDWTNIIVPHSESRKIDGITVHHDVISVAGREDGLTQGWTMDISEVAAQIGPLTRLTWPEPIYTVDQGATYEYRTSTVRFVYSSLTTPQTWIDINFKTGERIVVKQKEVLGYNPADFTAERHTAVAADGVGVSISLVRRADLDMSKPHPTLLYGYGSYGICIDPEFTQSILPYLKRGIVYCIAHIRGGGENGRLWYEKHGKYLTKRNTFSDFVSCAEYIVDKGISTPAQLAIEGRSAGGLLMGAVVNLRPDLFRVAVAGVPFVDVLVTMMDATIPLTTGEWEEWGNPNENKFFSYMKQYSPMDNIVEGRKLPSVLIVAGLHDPRVAYWEPTKWATKLRRAQLPLLERGVSVSQLGEIFMKMDLEAGHFSASDRYRYLKEKSFEQAYVLSKIGHE